MLYFPRKREVLNMNESIAVKRTKTQDMVQVALGTVLIIICAWISIPLTVPFTLQTFAIFAVAGLLGGKKGTLAVLVYILLGAVGLPVFAGFKSGIGVLASSTGGYIIGFLLSPMVMWAAEKLKCRNTFTLVLSMASGLILCYVFGTLWFVVIYTGSTGEISFQAALMMCVVPFIIPDLVKIFLAVLVTKRMKRYIQ